MEDSFQNKSYESHSSVYKDYRPGGSKEAHAKTWLLTDTVDAWRHRRMYESIDPILTADPQARWLTVGDGRYGCDAKYILEKGSPAVASNITDDLLSAAKEGGHIVEYKIENAEAMSFDDASFDYVLCKESYHHFPRPMLAFYEMLRVAEKGVVLIEPNDAYINNTPSGVLLRGLKNIVKRCLGRKAEKHVYEESGNYLYAISRREIEKTALGLNCKTIAFKGINDAYIDGVEHEKLDENGPLQKKARGLIKLADVLCRLCLMEYGLLAAVIFKNRPSPDLLLKLEQAGYKINSLPDNPYIT